MQKTFPEVSSLSYVHWRVIYPLLRQKFMTAFVTIHLMRYVSVDSDLMSGVKKVFGSDEKKELVDPYFVFSFAGQEVILLGNGPGKRTPKRLSPICDLG